MIPQSVIAVQAGLLRAAEEGDPLARVAAPAGVGLAELADDDGKLSPAVE
jgi:hypothetical protein